MKVIEPSYEILTPINGAEILKQIERIGRVCYKSENLITDESAPKFVKGLIERGHEAMLEHCSFSVKLVVDRGVSHELCRHRIASFAQESTRYANYSKNKFGNEITVIKPCFWKGGSVAYEDWYRSCKVAEDHYLKLIADGAQAQEARAVLPNSLKTEIIITTNLREFRHFFKLRAAGTTGKPHPQMLEVTIPLLKELQEKIPIVFDDIKPYEE